MQHLSPHDVMTMFMALATLLGCAKLAAELDAALKFYARRERRFGKTSAQIGMKADA